MKKLGLSFVISGAFLFGLLYWWMFELESPGIALILNAVFSLVLFNLGIAFLFINLPLAKRKNAAIILLSIGICMVGMTWLLRYMHLPGAGLLFIQTTLFLCFAFTPLLVKNRFEKWKPYTHAHFALFLLCFGDLWSMLSVLLGYLFKNMHWPGSYFLLVSSMVSVALTIFGWNQMMKKVVRMQKQTEEKLADALGELKVKHNLIEEKQKEIIDSIHYAKRIQKAQLPTDKIVDKHLKRLNNS